jgi:RNA polymerase subunit RPABC4/transcription elongation factor Spt4
MPPKIDAKILGEYPYPIARSYYRAYKQTRDETQIHDFMMDLYEVIVKYMAVLVMSQYASEGGGDQTVTDSLQALERPSLGNWVGWMRDIISFYGKQRKPLVVSELSTCLNEKYREGTAVLKGYNELKKIVFSQMNRGDDKQVQTVTLRDFLELLLQYRNGTAHGAKLSAYDREKVVNVLSPAMEEMLDHMAFLARYRLVWINSVQRAGGRTRQYEHYVTDLTGNYPSSVRDPYLMANDEAIPEQLYINAAGQEYSPALNLHPLLIYYNCPKCNTDQTFVLNEGNETKLSYLSYQCGHQFSPTAYVDDLKALRESINLGVGSGLPHLSIPIHEQVAAQEQRSTTVMPEQPSQPPEQEQPAPPSPVVQSNPPSYIPPSQPVQPNPPQQIPPAQPVFTPPNNPQLTYTPPYQPPAPSQIACWRCHMLNGVDRELCFNCGANLRTPISQPPPPPQAPFGQQVCPRCGTLNRADRKFCTNCGNRLAGVASPVAGPMQPPLAAQVRCSRCGTMNAPNKRFCTSCGNRLA